MPKKKASPKSPSQSKKSETDDAAADSQQLNFEDSLLQVEQIVARLEGGQLGLSESLEQYEAGIRKLKRCHQLLDAAVMHDHGGQCMNQFLFFR